MAASPGWLTAGKNWNDGDSSPDFPHEQRTLAFQRPHDYVKCQGKISNVGFRCNGSKRCVWAQTGLELSLELKNKLVCVDMAISYLKHRKM